MANLSAPRVLEFVGEQEEFSARVAASVTYYKGGLLAIISGYANKPTNTAALYPAGIVAGVYEGGLRDDALVVPSGSTPRALLKRGKVWLPFSGAAQTDVGLLFYIADDQTISKTAGSKTVGFVAEDFKDGYVLIDLRKPITVSASVPVTMADITDLASLKFADLADVAAAAPTNNDTLKFVTSTGKWTVVAVTD